MTDASYKHIGRSLPLIDGRARVTGALRYTPDLTLPGMLHARLVTSPYAHARVGRIERDAALALPGVVAVLTAAELPDFPPTSRHRLLLARQRALFVGHPLALVLATSEEAAEDGAELVWAELEPLPAVQGLGEAMRDGAPLVWPDGLPGQSEEAAAHGADVGGQEQGAKRPSNIAGRVHFARGDVQQGFAEADAVVERRFRTAMVHQSYLEPHATLAQPDPMGGMTLWTSTQAPFYVQEEVAALLGVDESEVRVHAMPPGGAFGGKFILYEPLVALAAVHVAAPVRLVLTRSEEMLAGNPAPAGELWLRAGATRAGELVALEAEIRFDAGCFPGGPSGIAAVLAGSLYRVPNVELRGVDVLTFKPSQGAYRAPGAPQGFFALETVMDELAAQLGLDPLHFRMQNASGEGDPMVTGRPWPGIGLRAVLEALAAHPAWQGRHEARAAGRGVGFAVGGWGGGIEPAAASCTIHRDGTLHVHLSSVDLTGTDTTFALVAAESFGLEPERVRIVRGDTTNSPYAGAAGGSKITYTVAPAVMQAAQQARDQVLAIVAEELEAAPEDLEIVGGAVSVRGLPDRAIPLGEVAAMTMQFAGKYAPVLGQGRHAERRAAPGFCAQLVELSVDEETGRVVPERIVVIQDVGRALNPLMVQGQLMGGAVQGLGWGLYEQLVYDESGQLLTGSLMDYGIPTFQQSAPIETVIIEVPSDHGPFGARGVGEPPIIPTAAAVANAIADATGLRLTELPITPRRLRAALEAVGR